MNFSNLYKVRFWNIGLLLNKAVKNNCIALSTSRSKLQSSNGETCCQFNATVYRKSIWNWYQRSEIPIYNSHLSKSVARCPSLAKDLLRNGQNTSITIFFKSKLGGPLCGMGVFRPWTFMILKSSYENLSNKGSNFTLNPLCWSWS